MAQAPTWRPFQAARAPCNYGAAVSKAATTSPFTESEMAPEATEVKLVEEKKILCDGFTQVLLAAFLVLGTLNVLCMKAVLTHPSQDGAFEKPGFVTLQMFVGMTCGGSLLNWLQGLSMKDALAGAAMRQNWKVWVITLLDLISFLLDMFALVALKPSIYMSLRGASAVWAFGLRVSLLQKLPTPHELNGFSMMLLAIGLCTAGGCYMPTASMSNISWTTSSSVAGVFILLGSAFLKALQLTWEEVAMKKEDISAGALLIGQGVWGGLAMVAVLAVLHFLPGDDAGGAIENSQDTVERLIEDPTLYLLACMALPLLMMGYNVLLKLVTKRVSGFCSIVMTFGIRPLTVWMLGLVLTYGFGIVRFGETWKTPCSYFTFVGMILWVAGAFVYHMPRPQEAEEEEEDAEKSK
eukprot:TRINITY_DN108895_c0_g1_i1.p1 TRINITY_DN108895_c0_g1~~TRINITY_DN108895_c0_g1_i1.p1  ORF type:complete len:420 (-),score=105.95 TRINITY_DN108895_c0_g1_i1:43-1269(-)